MPGRWLPGRKDTGKCRKSYFMPCVVNITDKTLCIYLIWLVPYLLMSSATENDFFFSLYFSIYRFIVFKSKRGTVCGHLTWPTVYPRPKNLIYLCIRQLHNLQICISYFLLHKIKITSCLTCWIRQIQSN